MGVPTSVAPRPRSARVRLLETLSGVLDGLQAKFPPNRIAVSLVLVLAPVWAWFSQHGVNVSPALAIAVLTAGAALLYKFVDGWQKHEERVFYGKPGPGEDSDAVEIALIEAETKKVIALIEAGHLPADVEHLLDGPSGALGGAVPPPAPNPGSGPTSLPPRPPTAA